MSEYSGYSVENVITYNTVIIQCLLLDLRLLLYCEHMKVISFIIYVCKYDLGNSPNMLTFIFPFNA